METERRTSSRDELANGLEVSTGRTHEITLAAATGEVWVVVRDASARTPLANVRYRVSGPNDVSFQGRTGPDGTVRGSRPVPIDHYTLEVGGQSYQVEARLTEQGPIILRTSGGAS